MIFEIPKIDPDSGGALGWWLIAKQYVLLRCPSGHTATLHTPNSGHQIDDAGNVTPSVVCPYDGCEFHEIVRLLDWTNQTLIP